MSSLVPPYIDRLVPYSPGMPLEELERLHGVRDAVKLASNENPLGCSPRVLEAIQREARQTHRYPDSSAHRLRVALAETCGVTADQVTVGSGSTEIIDLVCRTFASPDDHAVIGDPSFVCYGLGLTTANVPFTKVPLIDHLRWDVDALLDAVTPKTKVLFVANPNNPTGAHLGETELVRLLRSLPQQVVAVIDEAYSELADAPDYVSAFRHRDLRERLIILRTFSKVHGLAALRVGYAIATSEIIGYIDRVRAPFSVNSLAQAAALAALADEDHVRKYVALNAHERVHLSKGLEALGLRVAPSQTNFLLVDFRRPGHEVHEALLPLGVIVRPVPPPIESWVRITIGLPEENARLLAALEQAVLS